MVDLKNMYLINNDSKQFHDIFDRTKKTESEASKEKILFNMLLDFYQKLYDKRIENITLDLFDFDVVTIGYLDKFGYYMAMYDVNGYYALYAYGENINNAFFDIAGSILTREFNLYEKKNHKAIKSDYKTRFAGLKYDKYLVQIEYEISKWNMYYDGNLPDEFINIYKNYLDFIFNLKTTGSFTFDENQKRIVYKYNTKVKKLIK